MENFIYDLLKKLDISYKTLEHEAISSVKNCVKLEGQQVKNLVLKAKKTNNLYFVILHDEKIVDLKALADSLGEKRLSFASEETLKNLIKCPAGTVTAFGLIYDLDKKLNIVIDSAIDKNKTVGFHPFINTKTLNIAFDDFIKFLNYTGHNYSFLEIGGSYE